MSNFEWKLEVVAPGEASKGGEGWIEVKTVMDKEQQYDQSKGEQSLSEHRWVFYGFAFIQVDSGLCVFAELVFEQDE